MNSNHANIVNKIRALIEAQKEAAKAASDEDLDGDEDEDRIQHVRFPFVQDIHSALPPHFGYLSPHELDDALEEAELNVESQDGEISDSKELAKAVLTELETPRHAYHFEARLADHVEFPFCDPKVLIDSSICRAQLVHTSPKESSRVQIFIVGKVSALSSSSAQFRVDRTLRKLLGIGSALGAFQFDGQYRLRNEYIVVTPEGDAQHKSKLYLDPHLASAFRHTVIAKREDSATSEGHTERDVRSQSSSRQRDKSIFTHLTHVTTVDSTRAGIVRNACQFFGSGLVTREPGWSLFYSALCLEALLLDTTMRTDLNGRLKDAVAAQQGGDEEQRRSRRHLVEDIYDARSRVVHRGIYSGTSKRLRLPPTALRREGIRLARNVLRRELHTSL